MRERSQTTPRRRRAGPKQALPGSSSEGVGALESPYYTIDNTEDIYGTTLLPSQRCYVDPWDLENYDYVRKKIDDVTGGGVEAIEPAYGGGGNSLTPSPTYGYAGGVGVGVGVGVGMSATMPRPHTQSRRVSRAQCQLECCVPQRTRRRSRSARKEPLYTARSDIYGVPSRYEDYMATMTRQLQLDNGEDEEPEDLYGEEQRQLYNGFGGFSSTSSTEHPSSIGDERAIIPQRRAATLQRRSVPNEMQRSSNMAGGYGTAPHPRRKRSGKSLTPLAAPPQIEFPAPPPLSPAYDYCNPYATLPYCSIPDCSECQQQIYAAPSTLYGPAAGDGSSRMRGSSPHHSSGGDSSLYSGIYARKFGLSKKGLLQIDYSCSWNDLDRVMQRHF